MNSYGAGVRRGREVPLLPLRPRLRRRGTSTRTAIFTYDKFTKVSLVTLAADEKSPFLTRNDEEGAPADSTDGKNGEGRQGGRRQETGTGKGKSAEAEEEEKTTGQARRR